MKTLLPCTTRGQNLHRVLLNLASAKMTKTKLRDLKRDVKHNVLNETGLPPYQLVAVVSSQSLNIVKKESGKLIRL